MLGYQYGKKGGERIGKNEDNCTSLSRRRLRLLGHVSKMGEWQILREFLVCKPDGGKQVVGGQNLSLRWNDVMSKDLKLCVI